MGSPNLTRKRDSLGEPLERPIPTTIGTTSAKETGRRSGSRAFWSSESGSNLPDLRQNVLKQQQQQQQNLPNQPFSQVKSVEGRLKKLRRTDSIAVCTNVSKTFPDFSSSPSSPSLSLATSSSRLKHTRSSAALLLHLPRALLSAVRKSNKEKDPNSDTFEGPTPVPQTPPPTFIRPLDPSQFEVPQKDGSLPVVEAEPTLLDPLPFPPFESNYSSADLGIIGSSSEDKGSSLVKSSSSYSASSSSSSSSIGGSRILREKIKHSKTTTTTITTTTTTRNDGKEAVKMTIWSQIEKSVNNREEGSGEEGEEEGSSSENDSQMIATVAVEEIEEETTLDSARTEQLRKETLMVEEVSPLTERVYVELSFEEDSLIGRNAQNSNFDGKKEEEEGDRKSDNSNPFPSLPSPPTLTPSSLEKASLLSLSTNDVLVLEEKREETPEGPLILELESETTEERQLAAEMETRLSHIPDNISKRRGFRLSKPVKEEEEMKEVVRKETKGPGREPLKSKKEEEKVTMKPAGSSSASDISSCSSSSASSTEPTRGGRRRRYNTIQRRDMMRRLNGLGSPVMVAAARRLPMFSLPIDRLCSIEANQVPSIVEKAIKYLTPHCRLEGLFRISGNQEQIQWLKKRFDSWKNVELERVVTDPHVTAGLLKLYLRELPQPLMTFHLHFRFIKCLEERTEQDQVEAMRRVLSELPPTNSAVVKRLFGFLHLLSLNSSTNLMTAENFGIIFGPTLMRSSDASAASPNMAYILQLSSLSNVVALLINRYNDFFPSPSSNSNSPSRVPTSFLAGGGGEEDTLDAVTTEDFSDDFSISERSEGN